MRSAIRSAALVEVWFDMLPAAQMTTARTLQQAVLAAAPQLAQEVKWGNLLFTDNGAHLLAIMTHRSHVNLQVFHGTALAARFPILEGNGKGMRHLKLRYAEAVDVDLIHALVVASLQQQRP